MDQIIPWKKLTHLIEHHYPKAGNGRPPMGVQKMLRIYFMQYWFNLSDPVMEDALYDSNSMARFAGIDLSQDPVPEESTILKFRHLLEKHNLTKRMFAALSPRNLKYRIFSVPDEVRITRARLRVVVIFRRCSSILP